jgi:isopentenyl-diphosphate delta-isomerase
VTASRKNDHIELCLVEPVESRAKSTLLEEVELIHCSLPELAVDDIDLSTELCGRRLRAPLVITGMTGGVERAVELNRGLAAAAERHGIAFGLGSQRPMLRDVAPTAFLIGNIGAVQAVTLSLDQAEALVGAVGADALAVHLNPGQEIIQPEGDRDFRGCVDAIARLAESLSVPVIAKETGCGLSGAVIATLRGAGVRWVDVSGAGGTTWVGVEALRARGMRAELGELFWDWGVPTAAATLGAAEAGMGVIASGGLRNGLDALRALALGASAAGMALPYLKAWEAGGAAAVDAVIETLVETLRAGCVLTGSRDLAALRTCPKVLGPRLQAWHAAARTTRGA